MNFSASSDYPGDGRIMQRTFIVRNIDKLTFRPEDTVLDVGCGSGEETKSIASKVRSVTGIDTSEEMLALARKNSAAPNITYSTGDAQTVGDNPEWRENFDKVVCFFVLHWVPDSTKAQALRSILACLKPGGEALFIIANRTPVVIDADQYISDHARWGEYVKGYKSSFRLWNRSEAETEDLMTACGWTNVRCEIQPVTLSMPKAKTKLLLKTAVLGQTGLIPESEQEEYLEDMWQWSLSRYEDKSQPGHVIFPKNNMVIHACKGER